MVQDKLKCTSVKKVCDDFKDILNRVIKFDIPYDMRTSMTDGNIGIRIHNESRYVDITQYMSPLDETDSAGRYVTIPIGLSILYYDGANRTYDEGSMTDDVWDHIIDFLNMKGDFKNGT